MATRRDDCTYKIEETHGTSWRHGNALVRDMPGCSTIGGADDLFDDYYRRWKSNGGGNRSDDNFLNLTAVHAAHQDGVWKGHGGDINNPCQSRTHVIDPPGVLMNNFPMDCAFGHYEGHGSSEFYSNGGTPWNGTIPQGGTSWTIDHARWQGDAKFKNIMQSATWGREDLNSYNEAFIIEKYRFNGAKRSEDFDANRQGAAIAIWDAGSASWIDKVYITGMEADCIQFVRGTPAGAGRIATFRANRSAIFAEGGGGNQFHVQDWEQDECAVIALARPGHGRPGGLLLEVDMLKSESGVAPSRPRAKASMLLDAEGWINAHFGTVSLANVAQYAECLMRVRGTTNTSQVIIENIQLFGPVRTIVHDVGNGFAAPFDTGEWFKDTDGIYKQRPSINQGACWQSKYKNIHWWSWGGGGVTISPAVAITEQPPRIPRPKPNRMASLMWDPQTGNLDPRQWNDAAGTPAYTILPEDVGLGGTTPPPPPNAAPTVDAFTASPTSLTGAGQVTLYWQTTGATAVAITGTTPTLPVDGQTTVNILQTTTFTLNATGPGGTTTRAVTVTVSAAPPPVGTVKFTRPVPATVAADTSIAVNVPGVTKVDLSFTPSTAPNYGRIIGTGATTPSLMVQPDGFFWWGTSSTGWTKCATTNPAKVVNGTKWTGVITLPAAATIVCIHQTVAGQGGAYRGVFHKLNLL